MTNESILRTELQEALEDLTTARVRITELERALEVKSQAEAEDSEHDRRHDLAAKAMVALIRARPPGITGCDDVATEAYAIADAMIAAGKVDA